MSATPDPRWERMWDLFHAARALPEAERTAWLGRAAADDPALRREVEELLLAEPGAAFMDEPASLPPDLIEEERDPLIGEHVGPYRIVDVIGEGGMGIVYLAEQEQPLQRRVALKLIKLGMDTREVVARFETERQVLAVLSHPNIARVFDAGIGPGGRPFFAMEHVAGVPITQFAASAGLSLRERVELFLPVCRAIQHAHQKGVIHRDLKPSNVLVGFDGERPLPKVIDFGVAKALHGQRGERAPHTEVGRLIGTPEYISPEQAEMSPLDVDTRTDVWSLGVLLYELLTGVLPWDRAALRSTDPTEIRRALRQQQPLRPSTRISGLSRDLDWIVIKTLEKDRTRRYATVSELAADLERHLREEPVLAGPPSASYRLGKFARRNRALVTGVGAVAVALILGIVGTAGQALRARRAEGRARARAAEAEAVNRFLLTMLGEADPAVNPAGREVTLRQVLDQAARKTAGAFPEQPGVEGAVEQAIGATYRSLGLFDEAEAHIRAALRLREAGPARDPERVGESHLALGEVFSNRGEYAAAQTAFEQARADYASVDPEHPAIVRALRQMGDARQLAGDLSGAAPLYDQALALGERIHPEPHDDVAGVLGGQALLLHRLGRSAEAQSRFEEALRMYRQVDSGDDPNVTAVLGNLANVQQELGHFEEAERTLQQVLETQRRLLGDEHPSLTATLNNLGNLEMKRGNLKAAESHLREALVLGRGRLGDAHPTVATTMDNLAGVLAAAGRHGEAESLYRSSLALRREHLGANHPDVTVSMNNLAALLRAKGDLDHAAAAFREVIPRFRAEYGEDHPNLAIALHNLGKTLMDLGRLAEAEPLLRDAARRAEVAFPPSNATRFILRGTHGTCLLRLGRYDEAEALLVPAHDALVAALGADHPRARDLSATLAELRSVVKH